MGARLTKRNGEGLCERREDCNYAARLCSSLRSAVRGGKGNFFPNIPRKVFLTSKAYNSKALWIAKVVVFGKARSAQKKPLRFWRAPPRKKLLPLRELPPRKKLLPLRKLPLSKKLLPLRKLPPRKKLLPLRKLPLSKKLLPLRKLPPRTSFPLLPKKNLLPLILLPAKSLPPKKRP